MIISSGGRNSGKLIKLANELENEVIKQRDHVNSLGITEGTNSLVYIKELERLENYRYALQLLRMELVNK